MSIFDNIFNFSRSKTEQKNYFDDEAGFLFEFFPSLKSNDLVAKVSDNFLTNYYRSWVKTAIDVIAEKVGEVEFFVKNEKGEKEENHEVVKILKNPNELQSKYTFLVNVVLFLYVYGFVPVFKYKINGKTRKLYVLDPKSIEPIIKNGQLTGWKRNKTNYDLDEIILITHANLSTFYNKFSTLRSIAYTANTLTELEMWQSNFFQNGGIPAYALIFNEKLAQQQILEIKHKLKTEYSGANNAFTPMVLSGGAKIEKVGVSPNDINLTEIEKAIRDKILGLFRVPKAVLGLVEDVNRANMEGSLLTFLMNTVKPQVNLIVDSFNKFWVSQEFEGYEIKYKNFIKEDEETQAKIKKISLAWKTINEIRAEEGLEPIEGGDVLMAQNNNRIDLSEEKKLNKKIKKEKREIKKISAEQFYKKALSDEKKFRNFYAEYLEGLEKRIVKKLKTQKNFKIKILVDDIFDKNSEKNEIEQILIKFLEFLTGEKIKEAYDILGVVDYDFEEILAAFQEKILQNAKMSALLISDTLEIELIKNLSEGLVEGEGINELIKRVENVVQWANQTQAERIAITETTRMNNIVFDDIYRKEEIPFKKWVTVGDGRVRDAHAEADGQTVEINKDFYVGGEYLKHPGDPNAKAENTINCRCRIIGSFDPN